MKNTMARQALVTFVPAVSILAIVAVMRVVFGVTVSDMTGDVASVAGISPLTGFVSNLGMLLWCTTAAICTFAAIVLWRAEPTRTSRFLLWSAVLSAYLLFDDLFMFHDYLAERYLGLSEIIVYAALGAALLAYVLTFRHDISRTHFRMLLLAVAFLATSVFLDQFVVERFPAGSGLYFAEDGAKWLGIAAWCSYYVRTSFQAVVRGADHGRSGPTPLEAAARPADG
jgi:hypothetical protein